MDVVWVTKNFEILLLYLDDILVFSKSFEEQLQRLEIVFNRLRSQSLKIKPSKCQFFHKEVKYLGHIVSEEGVKIDPDKRALIKDWKTLEYEKYYDLFWVKQVITENKFIKWLSQIASPLHATLSKQENKNTGKKKSTKQIPFKKKWNSKCSIAFVNLRKCLMSTPILGFPDFRSPFILETDTSFDGLGTVLSQQQESG